MDGIKFLTANNLDYNAFSHLQDGPTAEN